MVSSNQEDWLEETKEDWLAMEERKKETSNTFGGDDNQNTNWFTKERTIYISVIAVVVVVIITVAISCFIYNKNKSNKDEDSNLEVYA